MWGKEGCSELIQSEGVEEVEGEREVWCPTHCGSPAFFTGR